MPYDPGPYPDFSWSHTRRSTFRECPRKYYYQYYASHLGWEAEASPEARAAYRLKKMTNLHMVVGGVVHELAADCLRAAAAGRSPPALDALMTTGRRRLNVAWADSQRREEWERQPGRHTMLHEFYYGPGPSGPLVERIRDKLTACLGNLHASESFREAAEAPFVEVKEADRLDSFALDGHAIYAQPDLLYRRGTGEYRIVDWKTGDEREGDAAQLRIYALYVRDRIETRGDLPPGPLSGRLEYLLSGTGRTCTIPESELDEARRHVLDSIAAMRGYLEDPAINAPRPRDAFPLRADTEACSRCKFFELDEAEIQSRGAEGPF